METTIKSIISGFLKIDSSAIDGKTMIDKTALKGSILVHRMYGTLANAGITVKDYFTIKTYGQLLDRINYANNANNITTDLGIFISLDNNDSNDVGIDIEAIDNIPLVADFRIDKFFRQNFSDREISYCLLQGDSRTSFAGLFAIKEAIVKADNKYKSLPFHDIEIDHDDNGKPIIDNFNLSISHQGNLAIAVAIQKGVKRETIIEPDKKLQDSVERLLQEVKGLKKRSLIYLLLLIISLIAAMAAFIFY